MSRTRFRQRFSTTRWCHIVPQMLSPLWDLPMCEVLWLLSKYFCSCWINNIEQMDEQVHKRFHRTMFVVGTWVNYSDLFFFSVTWASLPFRPSTIQFVSIGCFVDAQQITGVKQLSIAFFLVNCGKVSKKLVPSPLPLLMVPEYWQLWPINS